MMSVSLLLWCGTVVALVVALLLATSRLLGGPDTLARPISLDSIVAIAQCGLGVYSAWAADATPAAALVALPLVAFLGLVSVARYRVSDKVDGAVPPATGGPAR